MELCVSRLTALAATGSHAQLTATSARRVVVERTPGVLLARLACLAWA